MARTFLLALLSFVITDLLAPSASFITINRPSVTNNVLMPLRSVSKIGNRLNTFGPMRMAGGAVDTSQMDSIYSVLCESPTDLQALIERERGEGWADGLGTMILFSLGIDQTTLQDIARFAASKGAVVLYADCYGIIGFSPKSGHNVELMARLRELHFPDLLATHRKIMGT